MPKYYLCIPDPEQTIHLPFNSQKIQPLHPNLKLAATLLSGHQSYAMNFRQMLNTCYPRGNQKHKHCTINFSMKDFFSNCDQIRSFLWIIWSHLLKIFFCAAKGDLNQFLKKWKSFCLQHRMNLYMAQLWGCLYSNLRIAREALLFIVNIQGYKTLSDHPMMSRFLKVFIIITHLCRCNIKFGTLTSFGVLWRENRKFGIELKDIIKSSSCYWCYLVLRSVSPYSVQMREKTDQKNSKYGHFSCSDMFDRVLNTFNLWRKINQFLANVSVLYLLKIPESKMFSDVFRGYRMGTLARNGLMINYKYEF